jgi:hypothetical protein
MSHPAILPENVVEYWTQRAAPITQREGKDPLPISVIGFYSMNEAADQSRSTGVIAIAANSREERILLSVPLNHAMSPFHAVPSVRRAFSVMRKMVNAGIKPIQAVVYTRDVTIGGKFALFGTSFVPQ